MSMQLVRGIAAQTATEIRMTLRRGESILVTIGIPVALLLFFASSRILPAPGNSVQYLVPGTLSLAIVSTGLVSLGIATAYERYYGVLKYIGVTPFPRIGLVIAKIAAVLCVEMMQFLLIAAVSFIAFGWRPHGSLPLSLGALVLGTAAFSGLGLGMAGTLRAEATLASANALFLAFLLVGGLYVPVSRLPSAIGAVAALLPVNALADVLRMTLDGNSVSFTRSVAVLLIWAVGAPILAARLFRWE